MSNDFSHQDQEIIRILKDLEARRVQYPSDLLAARRASFTRQVDEQIRSAGDDELTPQEQEVVDLLTRLRSNVPGCPPEWIADRRAAFILQIAQMHPNSILEALHIALQNRLVRWKTSRAAPLGLLRTSLTAVIMAVGALTAAVVYASRPSHSLRPETSFAPMATLFVTPTIEAKAICKTGYQPPLCLAKVFNPSQDLGYQGNGSARPAVAKDTLPGYEQVHNPDFVNDGLYGPGASWVSNSPDSWIKIDLGKTTNINTVAFGRDRLGVLNDGDPGQFIIAVAESDDVYADGNSSNDDAEYVAVYDSTQAGFDGVIVGPETILAQFDLRPARYIKITFENAGTAIDEVEAFASLPTALVVSPTHKAVDNTPAHRSPTKTALPASTLTSAPTGTPVPSSTPVIMPTDTPLPTDTLVPSTSTPAPVPTDTPVPPPTEVFPSPDEPPATEVNFLGLETPEAASELGLPSEMDPSDILHK